MVAPKRAIKWLFGAVMVGTTAVALLWTGGWQPMWELFSDREQLRAVVEDSGPLAHVVYLLLLVFPAIVLPLPAPAVAFAGDLSSGLVGLRAPMIAPCAAATQIGYLLGGAALAWSGYGALGIVLGAGMILAAALIPRVTDYPP